MIWSKDGSRTTDDRLMAFMAGDDVVLDQVLFHWDIMASKAHVRGLVRIGLLSAVECDKLVEALDSLDEVFLAGDFELDDRYEDGHSAIEAFLTAALGDLGKKVHTGRSRNDQVLVASRLYMRDGLERLASACGEAGAAFLNRAREDMQTPMPGYTHLQRAVPSTAGMWFAAFAEAFIDDAALALTTRTWIDANPLGTAAGYGVNLPLDRDFTTSELEFSRMQISPIYAQNSRGKFELQAIGAVEQALLDVRRFAWDLSLFTTAEFAFVQLPDIYTTGSSIMPNKRNPDVVELLRAAYSTIAGARAELAATLSLPSGYHRDLQNTKPPLIRAFTKGLAAVDLIAAIATDVELDEDRMRAAISPDMYATDIAIEATVAGVPFRDAYREAARTGLDADRTPEESIQARVSPGSAGDPRLDELERRLREISAHE